jgi:carbonic anhydrase/acetyltransferase-like protein (isoleucine patch superfamily)
VSKKYTFTGEVKEIAGVTVKRIRRISDGLVGGYIESENNLSHEGSCFVYEDALVFGEAQVFRNAEVRGEAVVFDRARVFESAIVYGQATIYGDADIRGKTFVGGNAQVFGTASVNGLAEIAEDAQVSRTPTNITGLKYNVTVTDDYVFIGPLGHPMSYWRKNAFEVLPYYGFNDAQITETMAMLEAVIGFRKATIYDR